MLQVMDFSFEKKNDIKMQNDLLKWSMRFYQLETSSQARHIVRQIAHEKEANGCSVYKYICAFSVVESKTKRGEKKVVTVAI